MRYAKGWETLVAQHSTNSLDLVSLTLQQVQVPDLEGFTRGLSTSPASNKHTAAQ